MSHLVPARPINNLHNHHLAFTSCISASQDIVFALLRPASDAAWHVQAFMHNCDLQQGPDDNAAKDKSIRKQTAKLLSRLHNCVRLCAIPGETNGVARGRRQVMVGVVTHLHQPYCLKQSTFPGS